MATDVDDNITGLKADIMWSILLNVKHCVSLTTAPTLLDRHNRRCGLLIRREGKTSTYRRNAGSATTRLERIPRKMW